MAIDTENELRSIQAYTPGAAILPVIDGTVDAPEINVVAWLYAGLELGEVLTLPAGATIELDDNPYAGIEQDPSPYAGIEIEAPSI